MNERTYLPGGSGGVWYVDDPEWGAVVHRPIGPWTPAVHDLLRHLEATGLDGVPRVIALEDEREVLTYLPGRPGDAGPGAPSDDTLSGAARWLRRYHDAVLSFAPPPGALWRQTSAPLGPGQLICHNDTGTYNWVLDSAGFVGMIDWDQAGPGHPIDDLAFLCWTAIPLVDAAPAADAAHRLRGVADAYGGVSAFDLLDAVEARMMHSVERITAGIDRGDPGMLALREHGEPERTRARVQGFRDRIPALRAALARRGGVAGRL